MIGLFSNYMENEAYSNNSTPSPSTSENTNMSQNSPMRNSQLELGQPCLVCGSPSTGVHYKVLSCNGCKTFFCRYAFSRDNLECNRGNSTCFEDLNSHGNKSKLNCRKCRLDRCIQQGMRKKALFASFLPDDPTVCERCSTSTNESDKSFIAANKMKETVSILRSSLRHLSKFRRTKVRSELFDVDIKALLLPTRIMENIGDYEPFGKVTSFKRAIPEWLTIDLVFALEFAKQLPDFDKFSIEDKEELVRSSCFTLAIAIQVIDSYFEGHQRVVLPDGTDLIEMVSTVDTPPDPFYHQMFVGVMGPLYRDEFTEDELLLALQLLFFTSASTDNLSENGQNQLNQTIENCIQTVMVLLISQDKCTLPVRYGSLISLNEKFVTVASLHKLKMKAEDSFRQKNRDFLIEQLVFGYRSAS